MVQRFISFAIVRKDFPQARPREMVSRSSKDKAREERVRIAGCIPPVRLSTLETDDGPRSSRRAISRTLSP